MSAPLHLSAYTDAYVTAELDKLMTNRLYTDVLVMDDEEEQTQAEGDPGSGATEPPAPTPSVPPEPTTSKGAPSKPSRKRGAQQEPKPPTPLQKLGHWAGQNPDIKMPGQYARQILQGSSTSVFTYPMHPNCQGSLSTWYDNARTQHCSHSQRW